MGQGEDEGLTLCRSTSAPIEPIESVPVAMFFPTPVLGVHATNDNHWNLEKYEYPLVCVWYAQDGNPSDADLSQGIE